MLTLKQSLEALNNWVIIHHINLEQYFLRYPYVNYQDSDLVTIFRHKLTSIIEHIISQITSTSVPYLQRDRFFPKGIHSTQEINILCEVKKNLQLIRAGFLTGQTIKKLNTAYIFSKLNKSVDLINISMIKSEKESHASYHRNRSFDIKRQVDRSPLTLNQEVSSRKINEQQKAAKLKKEIRDEMTNFLREKDKILEERRQKRNSSGRRPIFDNIESRKYSLYETNPKNKEQSQTEYESNQTTQKNKKKYNYLQKLEESLRKYKEQQKKYDQKYDSPEIQRFKTSPSTQYFSTPQKRKENQWENEFPEFENDQEHQDLKKRLDFVKISGIKTVSNEDNKWEEFCEDSIEKEEVPENLDDSLELMKAEEGLNKTGTFNILPTTHTNETDQYSFSQD